MLQMFSVIPNKFLPNSKNPCWYEEYRGNTTTDPYATNSYALYSKRFRTIFDYLRKVFWNHLYHYKDKHYRLRCLPHFYIIGQPKCGTTDLYDRLRLHPDVRFSAIKEPHWWTRKRFGELTCSDKLSLLNFDISCMYVGCYLWICSILDYLETTGVNSFEERR